MLDLSYMALRLFIERQAHAGFSLTKKYSVDRERNERSCILNFFAQVLISKQLIFNKSSKLRQHEKFTQHKL